ncbi:MAG: LysR family transcriptional regulator [Clostridiales bacterium]|nr:LysR family transcriptional regulator [Clostridiales bacterium]
MELRQLEYIVAIAEHRSISRAAQSLYISQSGLNQQLIHLEKQLDTQLFYRTTHHLELTQAGKIYVKNAQDILTIRKNTYMQINDLIDSNTGILNLGLTAEHGINMFSEIFPDFTKHYPDVTLNLTEGSVKLQHEMLISGHLDLGFVMLKDFDRINLKYVHLFYERLVLGVPRNHPLAQKYASDPGEPFPTIDLALFSQDRFSLIFASSTMRNVIRPLFEQAGYEPNILFETSMNHVLVKMVRQGLCCTIIPQSHASHSEEIA